MEKYCLVKTLRLNKISFYIGLLTSFSYFSNSSADQFLLAPNFDCGLYTFNGYFTLRNDNLFSLIIQKDTTSPYELLIIGGNFDEKMSMINTAQTIQLEIRKPIHSNTRPLTFYYGKKKDQNVSYFKLLKPLKCQFKE